MILLLLQRQCSSSRSPVTPIVTSLLLKNTINTWLLLSFLISIVLGWCGTIPITINAFHPPMVLSSMKNHQQRQRGRIPETVDPYLPLSVIPKKPFQRYYYYYYYLSTRLSSSLISPTDLWGNVAILSAASSIALTVGSKTAIGRLLGPPVSGMAISFLLASIGVLPSGGSPGSKALQGYSVSLATPLILLSADMRSSFRKTGNSDNNTSSSSSIRPMILSFTVAAASTFVASCIGVTICRPFFFGSGGSEDGLKLAAALLAKNIGGGINYVAVCQTLQVSPSSVAAGLCVDNLMALIYFPLTSILASGRPDVVVTTNTTTTTTTTTTAHNRSSSTPTTTADNGNNNNNNSITVASTSVALSFATIFTWLGNRIAGPTASIPCATALTLLVSSIMPSRMLESIRPSADLIGTVLLYLFFATAGAPGISCMDASSSFLVAITTFLCALYVVHGGLLLLCRRLVLSWRGSSSKRFTTDDGFVSPQRLLVASSAAIGGPATAAALAQANGWSSLIVPSILVGNIGYAIATFLGIAFYATFSGKGSTVTKLWAFIMHTLS